ncbi:helix-turn-helix domain-containing protein [Agrobacterium sp. M50-1]|jgi:predicted transcriptional regulator|uniref:helix-turn-helix domain-containing protein n=1 Tax=Agrobacterium sp. M50-1 TaxID=3132821 RepID=UPI003CE5C7E7
MDNSDIEPEHVLCRRWREEVLELSRTEMAALTGFSADAIKDYERGDKKIDDKARKRYRMVVAAVTMGIQFDWLTVRYLPTVPVEILVRRDKQ